MTCLCCPLRKMAEETKAERQAIHDLIEDQEIGKTRAYREKRDAREAKFQADYADKRQQLREDKPEDAAVVLQPEEHYQRHLADRAALLLELRNQHDEEDALRRLKARDRDEHRAQQAEDKDHAKVVTTRVIGKSILLVKLAKITDDWLADRCRPGDETTAACDAAKKTAAVATEAITTSRQAYTHAHCEGVQLSTAGTMSIAESALLLAEASLDQTKAALVCIEAEYARYQVALTCGIADGSIKVSDVPDAPDVNRIPYDAVYDAESAVSAVEHLKALDSVVKQSAATLARAAGSTGLALVGLTEAADPDPEDPQAESGKPEDTAVAVLVQVAEANSDDSTAAAAVYLRAITEMVEDDQSQ